MRKNRPFRVGDRVERRVFKRVDPRANLGKIYALGGVAGRRAAQVLWDDGSEQLCETRDLRRVP